MEGPHKRDFHLRSLPTRSVTLFPTRAQIVREIRDSGINEITVVGLSPTVDEQSIKVEGTGSAIITDIAVELLPNRDIFQEIHPDLDSDSDKDESDQEDDSDDDKVNPALDAVREKLVALYDEQTRAAEIISSAESRLKFLDAHGSSLDKKRGVVIEASIETYRQEREKVFKDQMDGSRREREIFNEISKLQREEARLHRAEEKEDAKAAKAKAKVQRAKARLRAKQQRRDAEMKKEKTRVRKERESFWPRSVYSVRITLDAASLTPGSSRRSSVASATDVKVVADKDASQKEGEPSTCDLTLTYMTSSAFWSPSYDLSLSTTNNTAMLCFDAQLTNTTSETWTNSKVTLSTSQANFSGLHDDTPSLTPWRLKVVGRYGRPWDGLDIARSREEMAEKMTWNAAQNTVGQQKPRSDLFGVSHAASHGASHAPVVLMAQQQQPTQQMEFVPQLTAPVAAVSGSVSRPMPPQVKAMRSHILRTAPLTPSSDMPNADRTTALSNPKMSKAAVPSLTYQSRRGSEGGPPRGGGPPHDDSASEGDDDALTILDPTPTVAFQDSSFEETGLTATYDLPHLKTLAPSRTASKQRVARIAFTNAVFTRTVVAKYKPAAYLRARLRNTSKLTLLKGPTGLTLDGTFLGRSALPRCSAGETFAVPLGIDPAIRVAYPKPDVTRSTTGVFSRGESTVYRRSITLVNTRAAAGRAVDITVVDQVPVSEDDKIRVEVLHPAGMQAGRVVAAGVPGKEGKEELDWGRATVGMRKAGEVAWEVVLNAGRSVRLGLQYEVVFPAGESVAQC
ncbi:hypothetical protein BT67DRAFT_436894 [Trichocladium antarcticum]|uniref:Mucoidy inhibitor A n=1 Tax=Trichocladium antarcticum TaxID=1450529 RepID=A0AAN6UDE5_9PEZI|nr:hypothetical protein BT67DRAFT_436894 [Trichocladium antarcticum]